VEASWNDLLLWRRVGGAGVAYFLGHDSEVKLGGDLHCEENNSGLENDHISNSHFSKRLLQLF